MDKIRSLISTLLGLLGLVALAVGLSWLFGPQGLRPGQQVLPTQQAMPIQQVSPLRTPTPGKYVEPTAPSEDWPTLTPPPTRVMPTRGTPIVKYVETLTPTPTRPPLALTPVPEGTPPDALQLLYYVADTDAGPELHAIGMDAQGRRWSESIAAYSMPAWDLWGLCLSPDNKYLAAQTAGDGRSVYIIDMSSERVSCLLDEPVGCRGDFYGWTSGGQVLFRPLDAQPGALDAKLGIVLVDFARGQYKEMELPIDSGGYSVANNLTLNAENSKIAYSTTDWGSRESAIWIRDISDGDEQLIHKVAGWIATLSWSPTGEQLLFLSIIGSASDLAELWLVNSDGRDARLLSQNIRKAAEWRYRPTWSPDGRHIALVLVDDPALFSSLDGPGGELAEPGTNIYVVDTVTGGITRLSSFEGRNTSFPTWSPDGRFVAFVSTIVADEHTRYGEISVASVDGSQLYVVSGTAKPYSALVWLPAVPSGEENEQ